MLNNDPKAMRQVYFDAWQKALKEEKLTDMEAIIVDIIKRHPEYHPIFTHPEGFKEIENERFALDHNPFFHLGLHVTIAEQIHSDRPQGMKEIFLKLLVKYGDQTDTEHRMMECLAKHLMESFQHDDQNNDALYLEALKKLL